MTSPVICDRALAERVDISVAMSGDVEGINLKTQTHNSQMFVNQTCI